jgi:hypothetical protein
MRATLLHNYQRAKSRISIHEQRIKRMRLFIVYVLWIFLLVAAVYQVFGFSFDLLWFKASKSEGDALKNTSQAVFPLPDNVSCRYDWLDRQTMQIRKSIIAPCNADNKPPEPSAVPTRSEFKWGGK